MCVSYPQVRYPFPRLAYASRSRSRDVCSVRNATFAMHKRTCTQERRASARRGTGNRICNGERFSWGAHSHGVTQPLTARMRCFAFRIRKYARAGLRQPLLVARRVFRAECDICDAQTHTHKSGGRQPAVVPENASATATDFSEPSAFPPSAARSLSIPRLAYASRSWLRARMLLLMCVSYPQVRYPHHGWLTPAAPGCATCVPCGMRHLRCTNARAHKSGGRQPAVVPENASATATDFSEPSAFPPARSLSIPRLAYASRSWLRARMLLLTCVSYPQVRYPPTAGLRQPLLVARHSAVRLPGLPTGHKTTRTVFPP
jgi:hypothetical protein